MNEEQSLEKGIGNRAVLFIIGAVLVLFLAMVLIPQDVWVQLSMKIFP